MQSVAKLLLSVTFLNHFFDRLAQLGGVRRVRCACKRPRPFRCTDKSPADRRCHLRSMKLIAGSGSETLSKYAGIVAFIESRNFGTSVLISIMSSSDTVTNSSECGR